VATPSGPQDGTKYTLTNADGTVAVFNDDTDSRNIGFARWSGLDSADVRENADDLAEADGGIHGNFWMGRRPIVGTVEFVPTSTIDRNQRNVRLQQAANCLRADAILSWTPDGGTAQFVRVRRNQPLRRADDAGWKTTYSLPLVAADPRIYSNTLHSVNVGATASPTVGMGFAMVFPISFGGSGTVASVLATNSGTGPTPASIRIDGPIVNPTLTNATSAQVIAFAYTLGTGEYLLIDTEARTIVFNGTTNRFSALDFGNTTGWWSLLPGTNDIRLAGSGITGATALTVNYRDAWI
jgi:hypothetical protein